jgi:hypothetical protein
VKIRTPPLTHAQRQQLIRAPIRFTVYGPQGGWSGTAPYISHRFGQGRQSDEENHIQHRDDQEDQ